MCVVCIGTLTYKEYVCVYSFVHDVTMYKCMSLFFLLLCICCNWLSDLSYDFEREWMVKIDAREC